MDGAHGRNFDRLVALDEFDMEVAAQLREHMRIPGMGTSAIAYYRDKLAMRPAGRGDAGFLVPEFVAFSITTNCAPIWIVFPRPGY